MGRLREHRIASRGCTKLQSVRERVRAGTNVRAHERTLARLGVRTSTLVLVRTWDTRTSAGNAELRHNMPR